ncbi:hypothetical protein V1387_18535, partial [Allomuricauda taeanensis]|uniref:hypothetical protein n=1 Tax=Flagellimonas taeanensis TaxID=1005926 RepID=UPI002E7AD291
MLEDLTPEDVKALKKLNKLYKDAEKMIAKDYSFGSGRRPWVVERLHAPFVSWKVKRLQEKMKGGFVQVMNVKEIEGPDKEAKNKAAINKCKTLGIGEEYKELNQKLNTLLRDIDSFLNPDPADMPERDPVDILKSI